MTLYVQLSSCGDLCIHEFYNTQSLLKCFLAFTKNTHYDLHIYIFTVVFTSENLTVASEELEGLEQGVDNTTQRIALATNALADLRLQAEELRNDAGDLKAKATKLQEGNVEGLYLFAIVY